tara:strand:+ start:6828 stop:7196 length:369 start_codon:yes stop_codon:yes gene_type:complete
MTTKDLIAQVAQETGLSKEKVRPVVVVVFSILRESLAQGIPVILPGIGTVHHAYRKGRTAKTLKDKEAFVQADTYYLKLKNSKSLKDALRSLCKELGGKGGVPALTKPSERRLDAKDAQSGG